MLRLLSGRHHTVCTGLVVADDEGERTACEITHVHMSPMSPIAIAAYVASAEPEGKAGGYAIQGLAGRFLARVWGCDCTAVGLPLALPGARPVPAG